MRRGAAVPAALRDSAGPPGERFSLMQNRERRDAAAPAALRDSARLLKKYVSHC